MKFFFLLALTALATQFAAAQITITQADMPSNNDTIRYSNAATTNLNFVATNTGANYNWDFSRLNMTAQDIYAYKSSFFNALFVVFFQHSWFKNGGQSWRKYDSIEKCLRVLHKKRDRFQSRRARLFLQQRAACQ